MTNLSRLFASSVLLLALAATAAASDTTPLYKDSTAPVEARVDDLLSRMTLREKVVQMQNQSTSNLSDIASLYGSDGCGSYHEMGLSAHDAAVVIDSVQSYLAQHTRLGIPALVTCEGVQGVIQNGCTVFPTSLAVGATFNPELMYRMATATAEEARAIGIRQFLSPVLDLARELRWGRVEECYSEDPFLVAEMAVSYVRGVQDNGVGAMPKHFIGYGSPTGGINGASTAGGENDLRNLYGYPFMRVVRDAAPKAIMSSYNAYDGVPASGSRRLLTDVLRTEMGFRGFIYSDWGAIARLHSQHRIARDEREAARLAVEAGMDMDCADWAFHNLESLVESGELPVEAIDDAVRRILRAKFELGFFDGARPDLAAVDSIVRSSAHVALAQEIAEESAVLLKNDGILPLDLKKYKKIALLGPNSNCGTPGDYSWVAPGQHECVTLYEGLCQVLPADVSIAQVDGCDWWSRDTSGIAEAARLAAEADVAIVAVGTRSYWLGRSPHEGTPTTGEGFDLSSLDLPGVQLDLLKAVKAQGKPLVVVLITGKPLVMAWASEHADAVLTQFYGGEQQGAALARIITGEVNPSGRLNVSFPRSTGNTPCFYNHPLPDRLVWNEDTGAPAEVGGHHIADTPGSPDHPGGRYVYESPYALWPFGYGLSYTQFAIAEPVYEKTEFASTGDVIRIALDVANIGERDGKETIQVYVRDLYASINVPIHQLKAFRKVAVAAGATERVDIEIPVSELALYTADHGGWQVEPGDFEVQIGTASDRILYRQKITYHPNK